MQDKSNKGCVYCFCLKQNSNSIYYVLEYMDAFTDENALKKIETEHPGLKGKLSLFKKIEVPDIEKAKTWFEQKLNNLYLEQKINRSFYDDRNHKLRLINTDISPLAGEEIKKLMKDYDRTLTKSNPTNERTDFLMLVLILLGLLVVSFSKSTSDTKYRNCIKGGGGNACRTSALTR